MKNQTLNISVLHRCAHPVALWVWCTDDTLGEQARIAAQRLCASCDDSYKTAFVGAVGREAMAKIEVEWTAATGPLTPARRQELLAQACQATQ